MHALLLAFSATGFCTTRLFHFLQHYSTHILSRAGELIGTSGRIGLPPLSHLLMTELRFRIEAFRNDGFVRTASSDLPDYMQTVRENQEACVASLPATPGVIASRLTKKSDEGFL